MSEKVDLHVAVISNRDAQYLMSQEDGDSRRNVDAPDRDPQELERLRHALSHDLRAPIRAMHSFSSILERRYAELLDDKGRDFLERTIAAGVRAESMLDDLVAQLRQLIRSSSEPQKTTLAVADGTTANEQGIATPLFDLNSISQPIALENRDPAPSPLALTGKSAKASANDSAPSFLMVEDSEDDSLLAQEACREAGLANPIHVVRSGREAIAWLEAQCDEDGHLPILVLLDINLPDVDGFQVLHEIKANPQLWHLPVVMLTTNEDQTDILHAYSQGAGTYIKKPLTLQKLQEAIGERFGLLRS